MTNLLFTLITFCFGASISICQNVDFNEKYSDSSPTFHINSKKNNNKDSNLPTKYENQIFRNAVLLTHSSGSRLFDYNGYLSTDSNVTSVREQLFFYNMLRGLNGHPDSCRMQRRWFPTDPYGTDWINWLSAFRNQLPADDIYAIIDSFDIIIIKGSINSTIMTGYGSPDDTSGSGITKQTIYNYKWIWREIVNAMRARFNKFFVIMTGSASGDWHNTLLGAQLAHEFAVWATDTLAQGYDPVIGDFPDNIYIFDYFHSLTDSEYYLRDEYESGVEDDHPNATAINNICSSYVTQVFNAAINFESYGQAFSFTVSINNGWNMVSVPGLNSPNQNVNTWWAFRDQGANVFRYSDGYQSVTDVIPGTGYWMKHAGSRIYNTGDEWPNTGIHIVPANPLPIHTGWNLISVYQCPVQTNQLTTTPPGLQIGDIYGYTGGYVITNTLYSGYSYWFKSSGEGWLILPPCN